MISYAFAQTITPAAPPTDYTAILWVLAIAGVVVVALFLNRKYPGKMAVIATDIHAELVKLRAAIEKVAAPASPAAAPAPAAPPAPAGKNGVAGTFTVQVTGDPKVDLAAINSAYFS